ncbi:MAG: type III pantothenate kinase [Ectothiorhodospiraceae bacterium]|nr:type III pantothenate kinase [Ectothiorhodospiraceae bacterium]
MILLVDAGNTRIKWRCLSDSGDGFIGPSAAGDIQDLRQVLEGCIPERIVVACVRGRGFSDQLNDICRTCGAALPEYLVSTKEGAGVTVAYPEPGRLGVDRYMAMVAAHHDVPGNTIVISCGTATTFDAITESGRHLGGVIIPGRESMAWCLSQIAETLPYADEGEGVLFATDTRDAIRGGTMLASVAAIERISMDMASRMQGSVRVLLTGGGAPALLPRLSGGFTYLPDLVLRGMAIMVAAGAEESRQ